MAYFREITEHYRIERAVSTRREGGVYRATDLRSGAPVALKLLPLPTSPESAQTFVRSMGLLQELRHASLPTLLDFGFTPDGQAFGRAFAGEGGPRPGGFARITSERRSSALSAPLPGLDGERRGHPPRRGRGALLAALAGGPLGSAGPAACSGAAVAPRIAASASIPGRPPRSSGPTPAGEARRGPLAAGRAQGPARQPGETSGQALIRPAGGKSETG